jgi:hypothetical protein
MASAPPKVFISYSHDYPEPEKRVLTFRAYLSSEKGHGPTLEER